MAKLTKFDAPIPGEGMTLEPKTYPFDRPPKHVNPEDAADEIFDMITSEKPAKSLLLLLDSGMPVSFVSKYVIQRAFSEGMISFDMMPIIAGPVGIMITAMAQGAGIEPKMKFEDSNDLPRIIAKMKSNEISEENVEEAIEEARKQQETGSDLASASQNEPSVTPNNKPKRANKGLGSRNK